MPRPQTRALWLQHQRKFRHNAAEAQLLRGWNNKSRQQKAAWVDAYNRTMATEQAMVQFLAISDPAERRVDNRIANPATLLHETTQLEALLQATARALQYMYASRTALSQAVFEWISFIRIETNHPAAADNMAYAIRERNRALIREVAINIKIALYQDYINHPPLEPNAQQIRMVREAHLHPTFRQALRYADWTASRTIAPTRLHEHDQGRWMPWLDIAGGMSRGCLWLHFNQNNVVDDRAFRKDNWARKSRDWRDPAFFHGKLDDENARLPNELECHGRLSHTPGIVRLRSFHGGIYATFPGLRALVYNDAMSYRLYTEWCQHGSLSAIIRAYRERGEDIPEPFIWAVAEALADAGESLAGSGSTIRDSPAGHGPEEADIVHRDLKPNNVFLNAPGDEEYPYYPKPLLGDFGLAFIANNNGGNPKWYLRAGTPGYIAPEQARWRNVDTHHVHNLPAMGQKTNVYGYGLILWSMIMLREDPPEPLWAGDPASSRTLDIPDEKWTIYTDQLRGLIEDCLQYDPDLRPTFLGILTDMREQWFDDHDDVMNLTEDMRSGDYGNVAPLVIPNNDYAVGLSRPLLPRRHLGQ